MLYDEHFWLRAILDVYWCARKKKHVLLNLLLYQPEPKPVVYIVPIQNILGRLALAPIGEHGTIPYDWRHLQGSHYDRGVCDLPNRQGSGSKLFYINSWAMIWSSDHPRVAMKP